MRVVVTREHIMACMCGDPECRSCGAAQGTRVEREPWDRDAALSAEHVQGWHARRPLGTYKNCPICKAEIARKEG